MGISARSSRGKPPATAIAPENMNTAIFDIPAIKRPQPPLMDLQEIPGRQDPVAVESFRKLLPQTIPVAAEWELNAFGPHQAAEIVRADVAKEHVTLYKAQSAASVDSQRNAHNSLNGHPRLISGDPGPKAFMEMADNLKHPMDELPPLDADLEFAIHEVCQAGDKMPQWRVQQMQRLFAVSQRLQGVNAAAKKAMAPVVRRVAGKFNVGLAAFAIALLGWPDLLFPERVVSGHLTFRDIPAYGIWRSRSRPAMLTPEQLAQSNAQHNLKLNLEKRNGDGAATIWDQTMDEVHRGIASGPWSKEDLDKRFGVNGWRGIRRTPRFQHHNQKWRGIDDGSDSQTNDATATKETIHVTSADDPVMVSKAYCACLSQKDLWHKVQELGALCGGCQDEEKAYRQVPVHPACIAYNIVAVFNPKSQKVEFFIMFGSLFGLVSSVLNFN